MTTDIMKNRGKYKTIKLTNDFLLREKDEAISFIGKLDKVL